MIGKMRHAGIVVKDLEESLQFYKLLGFKVDKQKQVRKPSGYVDTLLAGKNIELSILNLVAPDGSIIELLECGKDRIEEKRALLGIGLSHLAFTIRDIEEVYSKLSAEGVEFICPPQLSPNGYVKVVFCRAPEGSFLELVEIL